MFVSPICLWKKKIWLYLCAKKLAFHPTVLCNSPTSPPTYMHTHAYLTNTQWQPVMCGRSGFYLLISKVWRELQTSSFPEMDPAVSRGRGLTLQFPPLSQPNGSSSENTRWEEGSCTWVLLQHSIIFCLLTFQPSSGFVITNVQNVVHSSIVRNLTTRSTQVCQRTKYVRNHA